MSNELGPLFDRLALIRHEERLQQARRYRLLQEAQRYRLVQEAEQTRRATPRRLWHQLLRGIRDLARRTAMWDRTIDGSCGRGCACGSPIARAAA